MSGENSAGFSDTFDEAAVVYCPGCGGDPAGCADCASTDPEDIITEGPSSAVPAVVAPRPVTSDGPSTRPPLTLSSRTGRFRFQGKRGFFTYPKLDMDPSAALVKFLAWRPMERAMVCRENHADGSKHLHVLFWAKAGIDLRSHSTIDAVLGKHGNYQVMKDPVGSVRYCMKEDDFVSFGFDPKEYVAAAAAKRARSHKWEVAVEVMQKRGDLTKFEDQAFVARNLRNLLAYGTWYQALKPVHRVAGTGGVAWKCRVVVVWGLSHIGKSEWANRGGGLPGGVWVLPTQRSGGVWWDGYDGSPTLVLEDFDSSLMNMLTLFRVLDSYKFVGPVKSVTGGMTADWIQVIITNNHHPHDWYTDASLARQQALLRRVKVCHVSGQWSTKTFDELYVDQSWPDCPAVAANLVEF